MTIKLIALDLDGTTINNDRVISKRNRAALQRAADKGVNIVIATGRPFCALPSDIFEMDSVRYVLTSNGASIMDIRENKMFYKNCMSPLAAEKSVELLRNYDFVLECFVNGEAYIDGPYYEEVKRTKKSFRDVDYILNTRNPVDDIYEFILMHREDIENINVNFEDISRKPEMKERLLTIPEATITSSFAHNLEIGGATTSKADALVQMGKLLGISTDEMMAMGDSPNDIAMLNVVGTPVAVGNALDEVKAAAVYVAPTNHEDGVAHAVEKFVLGE